MNRMHRSPTSVPGSALLRSAAILAAAVLLGAACGDRNDGAPAAAAQNPAATAATDRGDDLAIWREFVTAMKTGGLPSAKLRPYYENLKEPILGWLKEMSAKAAWAEWEKTPEVHRVGEHVHFLIPLTFDGRTASYCLTFLDEGNTWYFRHSRPSTSASTRPARSRPRPSPTSTNRPRPTSARRRCGRARSGFSTSSRISKGRPTPSTSSRTAKATFWPPRPGCPSSNLARRSFSTPAGSRPT